MISLMISLTLLVKKTCNTYQEYQSVCHLQFICNW